MACLTELLRGNQAGCACANDCDTLPAGPQRGGEETRGLRRHAQRA